MEAFIQLRYKNPTEDQNKATSEFVKGRDVFVSLHVLQYDWPANIPAG